MRIPVVMAMTVLVLHIFAEEDVMNQQRINKRYLADLTLPSIIARASQGNVCGDVDCQYYQLMRYGRRRRDASLMKFELCCDN